MTDLNFEQVIDPRNADPWLRVTEECTITYYDFGSAGEICAGQKTRFDWENGSAEYEAMENGLDVRCKLLPGSTWEPPPR